MTTDDCQCDQLPGKLCRACAVKYGITEDNLYPAQKKLLAELEAKTTPLQVAYTDARAPWGESSIEEDVKALRDLPGPEFNPCKINLNPWKIPECIPPGRSFFWCLIGKRDDYSEPGAFWGPGYHAYLPRKSPPKSNVIVIDESNKPIDEKYYNELIPGAENCKVIEEKTEPTENTFFKEDGT